MDGDERNQNYLNPPPIEIDVIDITRWFCDVSLCFVEGLYWIPAAMQAAVNLYIQGLSIEAQNKSWKLS